MCCPKRSILFLLPITLLAIFIAPSEAVILYRTATRNTSAPTGDLANSGWQDEGSFYNFLGTPVGFNGATDTSYFLTALHIGGNGSFLFNGTTYQIDRTWGTSGPGWTSSPNSDLRLWKVIGSIPAITPLYDASVDGPLDGKKLVVMGRGTQRGAAVYGRSPSPSRDRDGSASSRELKGWTWGTGDGVESWGTNYMSGTFTQQGYGQLDYFNFDRNSDLPDEAILSNGDSGGGVFVESGGVWKLAAVNLAVDGAFKLAADYPAFDGAIFDKGGLFEQTNATDFASDTDTVADLPSASYATDVSSNLPWIHSVLDQYFPNAQATDVPEPAEAIVFAAGASVMMLKRRRARISSTPPAVSSHRRISDRAAILC